MTKLAYLDCPTGISGDMCLGALIHAGVPLEYLVEQLSRLGISHEYKLWTELVHRNGQQATKVHVDLQTDSLPEGEDFDTASFSDPSKPHSHAHTHADGHNHPHTHSHAHEHNHSHQPSHSTHFHPAHPVRHLPEIERLITSATLPPRAEAWSLAVFHRLAEAEGAVHGVTPDRVHFHEVGATDALVDIVGTCLGLDWLGIDRLYCAALPIGGGTIWAAHGRLPVPAPAVLKLWEMRQVPVYSNGIERELVTPTGAAIVTTLATDFGSPPPMLLQKIGLGAGSRNLPLPNILRLWIGEAQTSLHMENHKHRTLHSPKHSLTALASDPDPHLHNVSDPRSPIPDPQSPQENSQSHQTVTILETQIDDLNPQVIGYVFEALFAAGALDVFTQAIGMKKSRPGILLTVICAEEQVSACEAILFRETTTLGIRHSVQQRRTLHREFQTVQTAYGDVRLKVAREQAEGAVVNVYPEYEDCVKIAQQAHIPWLEIHRLALYEWHKVTNA